MPIYDNLPEAPSLNGTDKIAISQSGVTRETSVDDLIGHITVGAIGFTPVNKAGDSAVGPLSLASTLNVAGTSVMVGGVTFSASGIAAAFTGTGAIRISQGTTAQRPDSGSAGNIRWNSTTSRYEFGIGSAWKNFVFADGDAISGTFSGAHTYSGAVTMSAAGTALTVTNNATVGGALTGQASITAGTTTAANTTISIDGVAGNQRGLNFKTGGILRLRMGLNSSNGPFINAYDDTGVSNGALWTADRTTLQSIFPTVSISKAFTYSGTSPDINNGPLRITATFAGNTSGVDGEWPNFVNCNINTDTLNVGATNQARGFFGTHRWGGTGHVGSRTGFNWTLIQTGATTAGGNFQAGLFSSSASYSAGGTDIWAGGKGVVFGAAIYSLMTSGATNWRGQCGLEIDYGIASGGTAQGLVALQLVKWDIHRYRPPRYDTNVILRLADSRTTVPSDIGIQFGSPGAKFPLDTKSKMIAASFSINPDAVEGPPVSGDGIDFTQVSFSCSAWASNGVRILPAGAIQVGPGVLSYSGASITLDTPASEVSAASVTGGSGGTNLSTDMMLIDDLTKTILHITAVTGGAATAVSIYHKGLSTSPPSNPVATFRPVYTDLDPVAQPTAPNINLTWVSGTTINIGTASSTAINIGRAAANVVVGSGAALATNATTGFLQIGTCAGVPTGTVGASGKAALIVDSTNHKLYVNDGGGWFILN